MHQQEKEKGKHPDQNLFDVWPSSINIFSTSVLVAIFTFMEHNSENDKIILKK